jgi:RNA polymerase sporulation-specific sigma factor
MLSNNQSLRDDRCDGELAALVKNGDPDAFDALVGRYMPVLQAGAGKYAGVYGMDRDDLIQEGMITLFRAVKNYDRTTGNKFSTYAITCINNSMNTAIRKHLRNSQSIAHVEIGEKEEMQFIQSVENEDQVGDIYSSMETAKNREVKIETLLSDFERRVLKLYLQGYSYRQSSEILSASTKAIDNALQRVRRKLRSEI